MVTRLDSKIFKKTYTTCYAFAFGNLCKLPISISRSRYQEITLIIGRRINLAEQIKQVEKPRARCKGDHTGMITNEARGKYESSTSFPQPSLSMTRRYKTRRRRRGSVSPVRLEIRNVIKVSLPILRACRSFFLGQKDPFERESARSLLLNLYSLPHFLSSRSPFTSSDYSLFSEKGDGGDGGGSGSYLHWKFREEGRLVKVVTANAREILFFFLSRSPFSLGVSLFPLISSTSHPGERAEEFLIASSDWLFRVSARRYRFCCRPG